MTESLTEDEIQTLKDLGFATTGEKKDNVHTFLRDVVLAKDTIKLGNLTEAELGIPKMPLRTFRELDLFCKSILGQQDFGEYFKAKGEILTASSLSKLALLLKLAVTSKKEERLDLPKEVKENKGWFKSKKREEERLAGL